LSSILWNLLSIVAVAAGLVVLGLGAVLCAWWLHATREAIACDRELYAPIRPAVVAWQRGDEAAARKHIEVFAADPATRHLTWSWLNFEARRLDLMPASERTDLKLAEGEMLRFLRRSDQAGAAPAAVEPVRELRVVSGDPHDRAAPTERGRAWLFRFRYDRPHELSEQGWMIGVAGPKLDGLAFPAAGAWTYSAFTPEQAAPIDAHVADLQRTLASYGWFGTEPGPGLAAGARSAASP